MQPVRASSRQASRPRGALAGGGAAGPSRIRAAAAEQTVRAWSGANFRPGGDRIGIETGGSCALLGSRRVAVDAGPIDRGGTLRVDQGDVDTCTMCNAGSIGTTLAALPLESIQAAIAAWSDSGSAPVG